MKRCAGAFVLLAGLGGCMSADKSQPAPDTGRFNQVGYAKPAPGYQGPWGEPVPAQATTARGQMPATGVVPAGYKTRTGSCADGGCGQSAGGDANCANGSCA